MIQLRFTQPQVEGNFVKSISNYEKVFPSTNKCSISNGLRWYIRFIGHVRKIIGVIFNEQPP